MAAGGYAQTVTGPVAAGDLGMTLLHEHILCDLRDPLGRRRADRPADPPITMENRFGIDYFQNRHQDNMLLDEDDVALAELQRYRAAGGGTIVELSTGGLAPQPDRLAALSQASGVRIVMGGGLYTDAYLDDASRAASVDELEALLLAQVTSGAWGSRIRAGIIGELGCSWPLRDSERRCLQAATRVQRRTGIAISVHPGRHADAPAEIAAVLLDAGAEPEHTILCHMDRTIADDARLLALLNRGFVLEWDFFGIETSQYWMGEYDLPTDYMRLDLMRRMIGHGHIRRLAMSQDICIRTRLTRYGGHGYGHILQHVVPMMRRRGYSDSEVEQILCDTPIRLLCWLSQTGSPTADQ
jgi:phosphotriesterase-related protein